MICYNILALVSFPQFQRETSFKAIDEGVESPEKLKKINHENSEPIIPINEKLKKNLIKKNISNKKINKKININNNDDSFCSITKENEEDNKYIDNENKIKAMNILT